MQTGLIDVSVSRKKRAERIRLARYKADMTKQELAKLVGVRPATYKMIEDGGNDPRISWLERIASHTGEDLHWLITGERLKVAIR